jgi:hypothetical protein
MKMCTRFLERLAVCDCPELAVSLVLLTGGLLAWSLVAVPLR